MIPWLLPAALLLSAPLPVSANEPLGRLFFTPQQRVSLESQRHAGGEATPSAASAPADVLGVAGVVVRSGGKFTVWVNGRPQHDNTAVATVRAMVSARRPGRATLVCGGAAPLSLRVGEAIDRNTGRREDVIGSGTIRTHPLPSDQE